MLNSPACRLPAGRQGRQVSASLETLKEIPKQVRDKVQGYE